MEHLNVKGMMKNIYLVKAVAGKSSKRIQYKSQKYGIEFVEADRWFVFRCGQIKTGLKQKDRLYNCSCGLNRDLNAALT